MRKFFVYFLILGVLATTALLTWAQQQQQLPHIVTTGYSEDGYHTQLAINSGGTLEDTVTAAKAEVAQQIFRNVKSVFNPRQKQAKNKWVPVEEAYGAALYNLDNTKGNRPLNAHLVGNFSQPRHQNGYVYVNVKHHELRRAYLEKENALNRQINTLIASAMQAEAVNPEQALQAYLQASPLFEQLKEAVLLQQATLLSGHDMGARMNPALEDIRDKLMETATGTNGGALKMSHPDVTRRVNQLQNQGRLANNVQQIATSIAQQFSVQARGMKKGTITIDRFNYRASNQHTTISKELKHTLIKLLREDGWTVKAPTRGMMRASFIFRGNVRENEDGSGIQFQATGHAMGTGEIVMSSTVDLNTKFDAELQPPGFDALQAHESAAEELELTTVLSQPVTQPRNTTGQALTLKAWTNEGKTLYSDGEHMTVYCRVNQPAYVRLIYVLANANGQSTEYTLLHDSTHIQEAETDVTIGQFVAAPPFGNEQLIVLAQKEPFPKIPTFERDGYYYIDAQSAKGALAMIYPPQTRGMQQVNKRKTIDILTQQR